jgi:glycosyltransferase involved in cell wall biosynthesis
MPDTLKTKIAQVLECGGPGGTGNQVTAICNGLDPRQFEVVLIYGIRPGADAGEYRDQTRGAATAHLIPEFVREISPFRDIAAFWKLYKVLRKEAPDVVHAHSSKAGVLARLAAWLVGVPRIYYSPHGYSFQQSDRSGLARFFYRLSEWSVSWIGEIIAVSPSEALLAKEVSWGGRIHTVCDPYLGPSQPPALIAHEGLVVGACGRITPARAPEAFVRLAARLRRQNENIRFVWIGSGELEPAMRRLADELGVKDRLEITGWLQPRAALERMRGLDVLVHYSRWEGLPNAVLEAMALGLPVVASDIPGNRDAVVHDVTGLLAREENHLLQSVTSILKDAQLRHRLGQAGRERIAREYSPAQALSSLQRLYKQN